MATKKKATKETPSILSVPITNLTNSQMVKLNEQQRKYLIARIEQIRVAHSNKVTNEAQEQMRHTSKRIDGITAGKIKYLSDAVIAKNVRTLLDKEFKRKQANLNAYRAGREERYYSSYDSVSFNADLVEIAFDKNAFEKYDREQQKQSSIALKKAQAQVEKIRQQAQALTDKVWLIDMTSEGSKLLGEVNKFAETSF